MITVPLISQWNQGIHHNIKSPTLFQGLASKRYRTQKEAITMAAVANAPLGIIHIMREIRDDIRANRSALDTQVLDLHQSLTNIRQSLAVLDERSGAIDEKLNTLRMSLADANGVPINLNQHLNNIHQDLTTLNERSGTAEGRLDNIRRSLTAANGAPVDLNGRLNTITRSLTNANGVPINLSLHVNTIRKSLSTLDRRATIAGELLNTIDGHTTEADRLLHTISTSITPNGVPINFNERLNTIDTNAAMSPPMASQLT
ncbi:hypothetical protein DL95DRAFT_467682 [Leptodontidium sp. 2 PMI_412]|nr:hypothetical protein DL95DRAFT_467682 [Leptodontidium sp. 2 PMI_412]